MGKCLQKGEPFWYLSNAKVKSRSSWSAFHPFGVSKSMIGLFGWGWGEVRSVLLLSNELLKMFLCIAAKDGGSPRARWSSTVCNSRGTWSCSPRIFSTSWQDVCDAKDVWWTSAWSMPHLFVSHYEFILLKLYWIYGWFLVVLHFRVFRLFCKVLDFPLDFPGYGKSKFSPGKF